MNRKSESSIYIGDITFDANNPPQLAQFWAAVLHYEIQEARPDWAAIIDPAGRSPRCVFQQTNTAKTGKNRLHLDLFVYNMEEEVARIIALGAQKLRTVNEEGVVWTVMIDLEGNEFCIQPPPMGV